MSVAREWVLHVCAAVLHVSAEGECCGLVLHVSDAVWRCCVWVLRCFVRELLFFL